MWIAVHITASYHSYNNEISSRESESDSEEDDLSDEEVEDDPEAEGVECTQKLFSNCGWIC